MTKNGKKYAQKTLTMGCYNCEMFGGNRSRTHWLNYHIYNADILRCSRDFCKQANGILFRFGFCDPIVQTRLLLNYCSCMAVLCGLLIVVKLNT